MKNDKTFWSDNNLGELENTNFSEYHLLADDLPVLLCRFKKDGTIFFVNKAYSKFFSTAKENLLGSKFFISSSELDKTDSQGLVMIQFIGLNGQLIE